MFRDRVGSLAVNQSDVCEHPTLVDAVSASDWQAYALMWAGCTVVMLGMAHRPWMDAEYDDQSLFSRAGWLVGHEMAHVAMGGSLYEVYGQAYDELLSDYEAQTHDEALADVAAALAVLGTGAVGAEELVMHVCQLWCARTAVAYEPASWSVHPAPNERCDRLSSTLGRLLELR